MNLFSEWENRINNNQDAEARLDYYQEYIKKETEVYKEILGAKQKKLSGSVKELGEQYAMDPVLFTGFLDGINSSLAAEVDLEDLTEDTVIDTEIDFEKLYYNMMQVKADWLYNLPEWDNIYSEEKRKEIRFQLHEDSHVTVEKVGRNNPCPCGSGKKYKKCCGK